MICTLRNFAIFFKNEERKNCDTPPFPPRFGTGLFSAKILDEDVALLPVPGNKMLTILSVFLQLGALKGSLWHHCVLNTTYSSWHKRLNTTGLLFLKQRVAVYEPSSLLAPCEWEVLLSRGDYMLPIYKKETSLSWEKKISLCLGFNYLLHFYLKCGLNTHPIMYFTLLD